MEIMHAKFVLRAQEMWRAVAFWRDAFELQVRFADDEWTDLALRRSVPPARALSRGARRGRSRAHPGASTCGRSRRARAPLRAPGVHRSTPLVNPRGRPRRRARSRSPDTRCTWTSARALPP